MGGALDFAPRAKMTVGEDTSNDWVTAAAAGTVYQVGSCYVKIDHGNGWITEYWHLDKIQVTTGTKVSRNQRLAIIHNNKTQQVCIGNEYPGPHLHFVFRPKVLDTRFAGWTVNYNLFTNITTFSKSGQTVGRLQPLMNIPDLQIANRGILDWNINYEGNIDAYRQERWSLMLVDEAKFEIVNVHSEFITDDNVAEKLAGLDGLLVAPGFGHRGVEGKIAVAKFAREHQIPFFGICLGMQCAVIEVARHLAKMPKAHSTEFAPKTPFPVVDLMLEQKKITQMGGSMRLGVYPCRLKPGSLAHKAYGRDLAQERHRHRYEFNNKYRKALEKAGLRVVGEYPRLHLAEAVELKNHPWYVAVQYHPELKSRPLHPHPLFKAFIAAALQRLSPRHG